MALLKRRNEAPTSFPPIPKIAEVSADFSALAAREIELKRDLANLEHEADELRTTRSKTQAEARTERAEALVEGGAADYEPAASNAAAYSENLRKQADIATALGLIRERKIRARFAASKQVAEAAKPQYEDALKRIAIALAAGKQAHDDLLRIVSDLNDDECAWTGWLAQPVTMRSVFGNGTAGEQSRADLFISEAIEAGILTKGEVSA